MTSIVSEPSPTGDREPAQVPDVAGARRLLATLAEVLDGIDVAFCTFDGDDRTVLWNRAFLRYFPEHQGSVHEGEPYRENLRRFYAARLGPDELPRLDAYVDAGVARHRAQARPFVFEHRGRRIQVSSLSLGPYGRVRAWRADALPVPPGSVLPLSDSLATEGPTAGVLLLDRVPDGMMVCDREGVIEWVNDAFVAAYGLPERGAALGVRFEDIFRHAWAAAPVDEREPFDQGLAVLHEHLRFAGAPFELPLPGARFVRVVARPAPDGTAFFAHVDISELKAQQRVRARAEAALGASQRKYRTLTESMKDVVWVLDADTLRFTYVSPSVFKLRGYTPEEIMAEPMDAALTPESRKLVRARMAGRAADCRDGRLLPTTFFTDDVEQPCRDGSTVWTEVITFFQRNPENGRVEVYGVTRDISQRKRLEQALTAANEQLAAASAAKSEFLAQMSHEIRTPLNAVLGLAQVLAGELVDPGHQDIVARIRSAGALLLHQLNDILDLSKIEAGQLVLDPQPFRMGRVLDSLRDLMSGQALGKGLNLRVEAQDVADLALVGDTVRLEQTLLNLVSNAIKFTAVGEIVVHVAVRDSSAEAVRLRFEVRDRGIGIPSDKLDRLFTPFSQAETGITRRYGGTGLGLAICKRLVERMGGAIGVASVEGEGSTFWFELPFTRVPAAGAGVPEPSPGGTPAAGPRVPGRSGADLAAVDLTIAAADQPAPELPSALTPAARLAGLRVLVVDDSAMNRDVFGRILGREGAVATMAEDGRQALALLEADPDGFDAVLMDVQMPVMDGLAATREIRANPATGALPVIAVSAGAYSDDQQRAYAAGVSDFLTKPIDVAALVAAIVRTTGGGADDPGAVRRQASR